MQSVQREIKGIVTELVRCDPTLKIVAYYARNEYEMEYLNPDKIRNSIAELRRFFPRKQNGYGDTWCDI